MKAVTVFTPAYNRGYTLNRLYQSLLNQSFKNFEWLIIDDGSTDDTENLVSRFKSGNIIDIRYYKQENGGKHRAINYGVKLAKGELFFIVDSDDYLLTDSLEKVNLHFQNIKGDTTYAGVCGLKAYFNGKTVGNGLGYETMSCTSLELRYKYHVKGDLAEVFWTHILKKFPFPDIKGEKFCSESLVWSRIAQAYKLLYFNENIYLCEYLPDGLSKNIVAYRMKSPNYAMKLYAEQSRMDVPFKIKIKSAINFWRFSFNSSICFFDKLAQIGYSSLLTFPAGYLMYLNDLRDNRI